MAEDFFDELKEAIPSATEYTIAPAAKPSTYGKTGKKKPAARSMITAPRGSTIPDKNE